MAPLAEDIMDELKELLTKLERAYNDRLVSLLLYGSAASGDPSWASINSSMRAKAAL